MVAITLEAKEAFFSMLCSIKAGITI
jgi:hypothetical protein